MSGIDFNTGYGDISFVGNDIELLRQEDKVTVQDIINIFKTNKQDYYLFPEFGMNLDKYIGRSVSRSLALSMQDTIVTKLSEYTGIEESSIQLPFVIEKNKIIFRLMIPGIKTINLSFLKETGFRVE